MTCRHWTTAYCGHPETRLYLIGPRCAEHTPARIAGRPEPGATASPLAERRFVSA